MNYAKYKFLIYFKQINWNSYLKTNKNDQFQFFELFFKKLDQLFDKHCPPPLPPTPSSHPFYYDFFRS